MEVTSVLFYILIAAATTAFYFFKRNLNYWKKQGIAHEEPHFLMGNLKGIRTQYQVGEIFAKYYHKFKGTGPFAGIYIVQRPGVVLLDKELIKNVLIKDFSNFTDRGLYYNEKNDPLTGHLFVVDGQKWRDLRNKLSPTFTSGKMKYMYPTLLKVADQFLEVLSENVKKDSIVDIRDILGRFTTDIIGSCAFGIECNSLRNPDSEFPILGRKSIDTPRHPPIVMAFIDSFPKIARMLGMRILSEDVHQFFMKTIKDTIAYRETNKIQRNDFLNILIDMKNRETSKSSLGGLTVDEICAQVFVFFLGGFETSSSTMTYALYELAQQQGLQDRLRAEVNDIFQNNKDGISYDSLKNMPYLDQVVTETLRKYPVVGQLNRQALNDYVVPGHPKFVIKKGMPIFIPVLGIQHDPEFYPNPEEFDPDRFSPEMAKQRDPMEWLPFGDGPRNCIGERFGKMQTRLGLAILIQNFRFSVCSKTEIPLTFNPVSVVYVPKRQIYLNVKAI